MKLEPFPHMSKGPSWEPSGDNAIPDRHRDLEFAVSRVEMGRVVVATCRW